MKLLLIFLSITTIIVISACSSSEYIYVKVKKSELMPDAYEVSYDSLIVGAIKICEMAQRFYYKPVSIGGGGSSFLGFVIPPHFKKTAYGTYSGMVGTSQIKFYGTGYLNGTDGVKPMMIECIVSPDSITSTILN